MHLKIFSQSTSSVSIEARPDPDADSAYAVLNTHTMNVALLMVERPHDAKLDLLPRTANRYP